MPLTTEERQRLTELLSQKHSPGNGGFDLSSARPVDDFDLASAVPVEQEQAEQPKTLSDLSPLQRLFAPSVAVREGVGGIVSRDLQTTQDVLGTTPVGQFASATAPPFLRTLAAMAPQQIGQTVGTAASLPLDPSTYAFGATGMLPNRIARLLAGGLSGGVAAAGQPQSMPADVVGGALLGSTASALTRVRPREGRVTFESPRIGQRPIETVADVLRVPEARLPKLTQKERTAYFQARSNQVKQQFTQQNRILKDEQIALSKELGKTAPQRSLYVREKLPTLYSKQSTHYRALVDRELAPVANDLIPDAEIRAFLLRRFAKDPERLNVVSARLGLINETAQEAAGLPPTNYKVGELYQKSLNLGQSIPRPVRESLRVYSPTEDATDDAISVIVDVL